MGLEPEPGWLETDVVGRSCGGRSRKALGPGVGSRQLTIGRVEGVLLTQL